MDELEINESPNDFGEINFNLNEIEITTFTSCQLGFLILACLIELLASEISLVGSTSCWL